MFRIKIETDNAAFDGFDGNPGAEVARILREVAARLERGECSGGCRDINGNTVGDYGFTRLRRAV